MAPREKRGGCTTVTVRFWRASEIQMDMHMTATLGLAAAGGLRLPTRISDMQTDQSGNEDSQVAQKQRQQHQGHPAQRDRGNDLPQPQGPQGWQSEKP